MTSSRSTAMVRRLRNAFIDIARQHEAVCGLSERACAALSQRFCEGHDFRRADQGLNGDRTLAPAGSRTPPAPAPPTSDYKTRRPSALCEGPQNTSLIAKSCFRRASRRQRLHPAVLDAIGEIHDQTDGEPDKQPDPVP